MSEAPTSSQPGSQNMLHNSYLCHFWWGSVTHQPHFCLSVRRI